MQGGSPEFRKQPCSEIITAPAAGYLFHGIFQILFGCVQQGILNGAAASAKEAFQQSAVVFSAVL